MIEGTGEGTSTDMDGNFTLLCHKPEPTLVFSYVGMKTKQVRVDKNYNYIRIVMEAVPNMMEEVVVTGYQNIKRENATGSYQIIRAEDMDKRYTGDITSNLEGRVQAWFSTRNPTPRMKMLSPSEAKAPSTPRSRRSLLSTDSPSRAA